MAERCGASYCARMDLEDRTALAEIDLYSEVVIAATASEGPLTQKQIDVILGVSTPAASV
jgi:hypothetical protein